MNNKKNWKVSCVISTNLWSLELEDWSLILFDSWRALAPPAAPLETSATPPGETFNRQHDTLIEPMAALTPGSDSIVSRFNQAKKGMRLWPQLCHCRVISLMHLLTFGTITHSSFWNILVHLSWMKFFPFAQLDIRFFLPDQIHYSLFLNLKHNCQVPKVCPIYYNFLFYA